MKKVWQEPTLEVLEVAMTMSGKGKRPGKKNDGVEDCS
ncbi:paeninodin family lasso peptide [Halalkalibacter sp. APA_J-10(15)]|nr:paeninodin family lasso peptide [Halalkalibacter sp. APA_J-10(15)]MCK0470343.1 paeninodin family lasso peptide [Halalkalibacter sp. APA_J-10(15)]